MEKFAAWKTTFAHIATAETLTTNRRGVMVIDLFGLTEKEVREKFPAVFQHVLTTVKPERDTNNRASYREKWWIHGEPRNDLRPALAGLRRYIATVETSKHRFFQFLDAEVLPDNKLVVITLDDAFFLGVLSSRIHVVYSIAAGGWIGYGNDPVYVKTDCFDPFPFPLCGEREKARIRELAEALDAHRNRCKPSTASRLTGLYNVLEKIRAGANTHRQGKIRSRPGLVSTLKSLHDDLDAAVAAAYGWPGSLTDAEILERLVALNAERAAEEARGVIHCCARNTKPKTWKAFRYRWICLLILQSPERKSQPPNQSQRGKGRGPKSIARTGASGRGRAACRRRGGRPRRAGEAIRPRQIR